MADLTAGLERVRDAVAGVAAVLLVDSDGMVVAAAGGGPELAVEPIAACFADLARRASAACEEGGLAEPAEVVVTAGPAAILYRAVTPECGLLLVLGPGGILGRARFELRKAASILAPELRV